MGEYEKALEDLERATNIVEDAVILEHLGDVYMKLGEPGKAREVYKKALEFAPDNKNLKNKILFFQQQSIILEKRFFEKAYTYHVLAGKNTSRLTQSDLGYPYHPNTQISQIYFDHTDLWEKYALNDQ